MLDVVGVESRRLGQSFYFDGEVDLLRQNLVLRDFETIAAKASTQVSTGDLFGDWWKSFLVTKVAPLQDLRLRPVRVVDLFSSVGGLSLGFKEVLSALGMRMESLLAVDLDPEALQVYSANFQTKRILNESVKDLVESRVRGTGEDARYVFEPEVAHSAFDQIVGKVDVILAGPPCQGHSNLNNHSRRNDPRNSLYLTVPSIAIALRAPIVIIENVPSVVHDKDGVVQTSIALLKQNGYNLTSEVLAADHLGWAQTRKRYFIVATLKGSPIPLKEISTEFREKPHGVGWAIGDLLGLQSNEVEHSTGNLSSENRERVSRLFAEDLHNLPNDSRPKCHQDGTTYSSVYGRMWWDKPAPTLTTGFQSPGRGRFVHPLEPRVLTPREGARIQGFPDWFSFVGADGNKPNRTQMGKWIGDAVPSILGYTAGLAVADLL
jgi:DNA (cytosine-5)-methyltransferase 1